MCIRDDFQQSIWCPAQFPRLSSTGLLLPTDFSAFYLFIYIFCNINYELNVRNVLNVEIIMELNEDTRAFVERMGTLYEHWGMTRTFGQVQGLLMVAREPVSLDELSRLIKVSKAAISTTVRLYRELGFLKRVKRPGDRRDYYEMVPGSLEEATRKKMHLFEEMADLADQGLAAVDDPDHPAHARLYETRAFYEFVAENMGDLLREWRKRKSEMLNDQE